MSWLENQHERVVVLEDRELDPISIEERWEANCCTLNMCTNGGPGTLLMCSGAPYLNFGFPGSEEDRFLQTQWHELHQGEQVAWSEPYQRIVWEPDDFDVLVREYADWREQHGGAR